MSNSHRLLKDITSITSNCAPYKEIGSRVSAEGKTSGNKFIVMISAILISSIGLKENSVKVLVGAALISPLIGSILSIGFALGTGNRKQFFNYFIQFVLETLLGLLVSTLYFCLLPIPATPSKSIVPTSLSISDIIIAFSGGIAATLELTRKKTAFIIPGVAIASSVTSSLCNASLGIARRSSSYFLDSFSLFLVSCFFLILSSCITTAMLHIPRKFTDS